MAMMKKTLVARPGMKGKMMKPKASPMMKGKKMNMNRKMK